jgi:hypothetical protein
VSAVAVILRESFVVYPVLRLFDLRDPTCDEQENEQAAFGEATSGAFGWGPNGLMVNTEVDPGRVWVDLEVWDAQAPAPGDAELTAESSIALPGGRLHSLQALEERIQLGVELPSGPGTYRARVLAYRRGVRAPEPNEPGGETYRLQLWQVSAQPRWDEDDD